MCVPVQHLLTDMFLSFNANSGCLIYFLFFCSIVINLFKLNVSVFRVMVSITLFLFNVGIIFGSWLHFLCILVELTWSTPICILNIDGKHDIDFCTNKYKCPVW